jgi:hypothetical protein
MEHNKNPMPVIVNTNRCREQEALILRREHERKHGRLTAAKEISLMARIK